MFMPSKIFTLKSVRASTSPGYLKLTVTVLSSLLLTLNQKLQTLLVIVFYDN